MRYSITLFVLLLLIFGCQEKQQIITPLENSNYTELTTSAEVDSFLQYCASVSDRMEYEVIGTSAEGKPLSMIKVLPDIMYADSSVTVMLFAQQHGNEQSGKEATLELIRDIAIGEYNTLLQNITLLIIPQVNPDGSDKDTRLNANDVDLNRNHLILTEPETIAILEVFHKYTPEVTCDIHEYYPYSRSWEEFGAFKQFDEQFGTLTNTNIDIAIIRFQKEFITFIDEYLKKQGFSFHEYLVGGPPDRARLRYSTVDINDGRQSLGIYNTMSFILEGKNGRDSIDNIKHRTLGQKSALIGLLHYVQMNRIKIKNIISTSKKKLLNTEKVALQMDHFSDGSSLELLLSSVATGKDTLITTDNFHPVEKTLYEVKKPFAYLIPKNDSLLNGFLKKHKVKFKEYIPDVMKKVFQYKIEKLENTEIEGMNCYNPKLKKIQIDISDASEYYLVPSRQPASFLLSLAFEPKSMLGLIQYELFQHLSTKEEYPILRVE